MLFINILTSRLLYFGLLFMYFLLRAIIKQKVVYFGRGLMED